MKLNEKRKVLIPGFAILLGVCSVVASSSTMADESEAYSIARGGRLYDKWFKESTTAKTPAVAHPYYPESGKYKGNKATDWRCKECHGWDYRGKEGAYASGKHHTGIKGIAGMAGADPAAVVAVLKNQTHTMSAFGLEEQDYQDLAMFVSKGQVRSEAFIDSGSKKVTGDVNAGKSYFETVCANCHGLDGKEDDQIPPLGKVANDNPWEVLHKIINGQPNEEMPALRAFGVPVAADILAYLQTLPQE
ncbi:MAG: c-type cytochrome [Gammaproteobacteria bacterium]|nr:c-type cytochrome [Gammaproteobacteria bacterium]